MRSWCWRAITRARPKSFDSPMPRIASPASQCFSTTACDCVESRHVVSKKPVWQPLGDVANRQARVAGINVAGGEAQFPGVLGSAIFRTFDLVVARTGLSFSQARESGFNPKRVAAQAPSRARYMPQSRPIDLVLTVDQADGRILGAEAVGMDAVDKCIDILATATWAGLSVDVVAEMDLAYAPPFSPVMSPIHVVGEVACKDFLRGTLTELNWLGSRAERKEFSRVKILWALA